MHPSVKNQTLQLDPSNRKPRDKNCLAELRVEGLNLVVLLDVCLDLGTLVLPGEDLGGGEPAVFVVEAKQWDPE